MGRILALITGATNMASRPYPSFLIYIDSRGEYRWKIEAANGRIIADSGEGYRNYTDCNHAIGLVKGTTAVWQTKAVTDRVS